MVEEFEMKQHVVPSCKHTNMMPFPQGQRLIIQCSH